MGLDGCQPAGCPTAGGAGAEAAVGEASCPCSCNTRARPLSNPLWPRRCAFARKTGLRHMALLLPGPTCKPGARITSTNTSPENTLLNLFSKLQTFLCTSEAGHCDGKAKSPLSWSLSQTSRAMTIPPVETESPGMRKMPTTLDLKSGADTEPLLKMCLFSEPSVLTLPK